MPNYAVNDAGVARMGLIVCDYRAAEWGDRSWSRPRMTSASTLDAARA